MDRPRVRGRWRTLAGSLLLPASLSVFCIAQALAGIALEYAYVRGPVNWRALVHRQHRGLWLRDLVLPRRIEIYRAHVEVARRQLPTWVYVDPTPGESANDDYEEATREDIEEQLLAGAITIEYAAIQALEAAKRVARRICDGTVDPMRGANATYWLAWYGGAWEHSDPSPQLQEWGAEFIQLADALESYQGNLEGRVAYEALTREAACSAVEGRPFPDWSDHDLPPFRV